MEIKRGKIMKGQRIVVYGPEGIGKSTFLSQFPDVLFIDTEGSTYQMDVTRTPKPTSWPLLVKQVEYVREHPDICKTLAIDTADWAEQLCVKYICDKASKDGIEEFGYGKGYVYLKEEFARLLHILNDIRDTGIHVVFAAHAQMRKFEQPDESGAYDRWELKLEKKTGPLLKEWADMILFANYKTLVVKDKNDKAKARGGKRVMYTTHHPCWDAKNRHELTDELDFDYGLIKHCLEITESTVAEPVVAQEPQTEPTKEKEPPAVEKSDVSENVTPKAKAEEPPEERLRPLYDLMAVDSITTWELQRGMGKIGACPEDAPVTKYPQEFVNQIIARWDTVRETILDDRSMPF